MKNTTNIFKILFLSLFPIASMMGQNPAFVYLPDMTGYSLEDSPQDLKDDLMEAADSLRAALPEDYRSDFAVYDMGFYAHHPNMVGGIPEVMAKAIDDHVTHSYYLVFGREMDREGRIKKVWVEVELPEGGVFLCINSTLPSVIGDLSNKLRFDINASTFKLSSIANYGEILKQNINSFSDQIDYFITCCPTESCDP